MTKSIMTSLLPVLLLTLTLLVPATCLVKCPVQAASFKNIPTFMVNRLEVSMVINKNFILPLPEQENMTIPECYIEAGDVFINETTNISRVAAYGFACLKPTRVIINGSFAPHPEITSFIQLQECEMGLDSLSILANITGVTVLNIVSKATLTTTDDPQDCSAFDGIGTLLIANKRYPKLDMDVFFSCQDHLSFMAEMILRNLSLTQLPPELSTIMPTLQGLDISVNNFTIPPVFPWDNTTRNLPRTLSRTTFFQNQYTYGGTLTIPDDEYRREFRLDDNPYLDLTNYTFRGHLHLLSLARCGLSSLPTDVFYEVEGLQLLSLAGNMLETIPPGLFLRSLSLHKLELQENQINDLEAGVFSGLDDLIRLDLSFNKLTYLKDGVFSGMYQLQKVNLKNNMITHISGEAFSKLLTKLKVVNLENNPLVHVPEGLFLLRGLYDIRLSGHNITDLNFTRMDEKIEFDKFKYVLVDSVSTGNPNIDIPSDGLRKVDMSNGPIQKISLVSRDKYSSVKIALLLKHFRFLLNNNPISCDCHILNFKNYVEELKENGTIGQSTVQLQLYGTEDAFNWRCAQPSELSTRTILGLKDEETYCPFYSPQCPVNCTCYKRSIVGTNIVDCRNLNLTQVPDSLPEGDTELWLQDNKISNFRMSNHLAGRLVEIHLERNQVENLGPECLSMMTRLRRFYVQNNLLAYIPRQVETMQLEEIKLGGNPLQCDCHSLWMKHWLLRNYDVVKDYADVKCVNIVEDTGTNILKVNDEDFICEGIPLYKIAVPTAVPTGFVLVMLVCMLVLYIHWDDFKVFLYVYTGAHPFDKKDPDGVMSYDALVVYPVSLADWTHANIVDPLQEDGKYTLYDVARDFRFGVSLQENIQYGIQNSRRMIFILSESSKTDVMMQSAIEAGLEKSREEKANFLIPVFYDTVPSDFENEQLQKYFKAKKYATISDDHFLKRLQYHMPTVPIKEQSDSHLKEIVNDAFDSQSKNETNLEIDGIVCKLNGNAVPAKPHLPQPDVVDGIGQGSTVFVWYADADFSFMMERIVCPFEKAGHNFILSDKSFLPGAAIQEEILHAVEDSDRTIIILSQESLQDEWTLYAFRYASDRQMVDKTFLTGIVVREGMLNAQCDEEIIKHLIGYQPLSEKDTAFDKKLKTFLQTSEGRQNGYKDDMVIDVKL